nr:MAG TPA: hypothetical protein [Caudoviricetes sp.]
MNVITYQKTTERMGDHDKKSRCKQCAYFGKASDAPETVEEDCMWQTWEDENCTLPCEKGAGMERLTEKNKCKLSNGEEIVICKHSENECNDSCMKIIPCKWYIKAIEKLKRYEDLEERLNKVYGDCDGLLMSVVEMLEKHPCINMANNALKSRLLTDEAVDKWEEYKQLEEQGRLIKLPCKVGDTVYVPTRDFISELRIAHITISKNNTFFHWMLNAGIYPNLDGFSVDKIGKTVFFTKSEAEAKLKELRGGEND